MKGKRGTAVASGGKTAVEEEQDREKDLQCKFMTSEQLDVVSVQFKGEGECIPPDGRVF